MTPHLPTPRLRAIAEQLRASDPAVCAFVEASAGSGKTKLLTDRILRLMLAKADPAKIQCLTFTKAAAAEMSLRLQDRLGQWAVMDDAKLDGELEELRVPTGWNARNRARELFARVLDLPGGMRIGTIHAFCQSLLRRFPLEAEISPQFKLVEDADARLTMERAREAVLSDVSPGLLQRLAGLAKADQFGFLVAELDMQRERIAPLLDLPEPVLAESVRRVCGAVARSDVELLAAAVVWPGEAALRDVLQLCHENGSAAVQAHTIAMLDWLSQPPPVRSMRWDAWCDGLFGKDGAPRTQKPFISTKDSARHPHVMLAIAAEQERVAAILADRRAVRTAEASTALLQLALPILRAYAGRKQDLGLLDYGDLIGRTTRLLHEPGTAWVLYKLDGGIDHLLLDEVQDTAPQQWRVAHQLTEEFFAGLGARPETDTPARTFFAVGDPKQSIYSFQGAVRDEFSRARKEMHYRVGSAQREWRDVTLEVSFRSAAPVLELVDAVFAEAPARDGVVDGTMQHYADRVGDAGRVELWPLVPRPDAPNVMPWTVPTSNLGLVSAPQRLAEGIASWVADALSRGETLPSHGRALDAGDILILVRRRTDFARNVVRALKARGVPVAGLDRLVLTEQAAVQDVLAACDAVLLPGDDLAVACVLTSPLGGLSQESLMALGMGRDGTLYETLRRRAEEQADWGAARRFLAELAGRADYATPHALLAEMLGPLGGRARLLARLGPEAAEPLDELLGAALDYTTLHPPSLQGFVHWLRRSGATIKREAGSAGRAVRVMTAHGAKGLQAPLVILPDTTALPPDDEHFVWAEDSDGGRCVPIWTPRKELRCERIDILRARDRVAQMQEYNRLLYVALTRAEDRLIVCGWETRRALPDESWYAMVAKAFGTIDARPAPSSLSWSDQHILVRDCEQTQPPRLRGAMSGTAAVPLPAWAGRPGDWRPAPPPIEPALPSPLAPSRPDDVAFGPVPRALSPRTIRERFSRGTLVHELLQHLPSMPASAWQMAAERHVRRHGLATDEATSLIGETLAVLRHPALAPLFGAAGRAEQPITGLVGRTVITGKVDRLAVLPDAVLLVDYKTGRAPPAKSEDTPVLYLRQMAAYRALLQKLYPALPVHCSLVWTHGPAVVALPPALLDAHAPAS